MYACVCVCVSDRKKKESKLKGRVCFSKEGLESVRREFPKFSKRAARIILLKLVCRAS